MLCWSVFACLFLLDRPRARGWLLNLLLLLLLLLDGVAHILNYTMVILVCHKCVKVHPRLQLALLALTVSYLLLVGEPVAASFGNEQCDGIAVLGTDVTELGALRCF
jgi:hypothetical protein